MKRTLLTTAFWLTLLVAVPAQAQLNGSHTPGDYGVVGVTGAWVDDGDNNPESTDAYLCTGVSQVSVNVKA